MQKVFKSSFSVAFTWRLTVCYKQNYRMHGVFSHSSNYVAVAPLPIQSADTRLNTSFIKRSRHGLLSQGSHQFHIAFVCWFCRLVKAKRWYVPCSLLQDATCLLWFLSMRSTHFCLKEVTANMMPHGESKLNFLCNWLVMVFCQLQIADLELF